ncbi:MAG: hypothetical protein M0Z41_08835 [Peptococcaceae bacterium]|jgi:DNA topoisomerase VI subunit B|nr:hypothetical protein [Peptococcaceae bacterium]
MIYTFPRSAEFFQPAGLAMSTGLSSHIWEEILVKEFMDNALDAVDGLVDPAVTIQTGATLTVTDNGPGLDLQDFSAKILDFSSSVSSKLAWRRPSRGYLGNAWQTILAISHQMSPGRPIVIESQGQRVSITLRLTGDGFVQVEPKYSVAVKY